MFGWVNLVGRADSADTLQHKDDMTISAPGKNDDGLEGLSFAEILRDCLVCGVVVIDAQRKITAFNPEVAQFTRLNPKEVLNRPAEVLPPALQEVIQETLMTREPVQDRQLVLHGQTQDAVVLRVSATPLVAGAGKISGVVAVLNDLTSAQKMEQSMRQFDRLASIGTLSASMAHEIKNALVAVKTFVDLLLKQNQDAELAGMASRELRRIDSIVSQMLRFAGPAKPTFASVRLHEILEHALRLIQFQLEGRKISLRRQFAASPDWVRGDRYQLEQVFINLFFNAIEAMGPHGQLTVATELIPTGSPDHSLPDCKNQPLLRVNIQDTGTGIPPENIGRLFDTFFTTKPNGTGLGLTITRRIVQEHRGVVTVDSEVNKGSTFRVVFPALNKPH